MRTMSLGDFLSKPGRIAREAADGEYTTIRLSNGSAAVMVDETEYTMLRQALSLCMEHPEWTSNRK